MQTQQLVDASEAVGTATPGVLMRDKFSLSVTYTHAIQDVEAIWRGFEAVGVESPGQSYDFIKLWVEQQQIPSKDQIYVVASLDGAPLALLPLHRKSAWGLTRYCWFPGANVGAYAPLLDRTRFAALSKEERVHLWAQLLVPMRGADLVYLRAVPVALGGHSGLLTSLGTSLTFDTLYRSEYSSWAQCDQLQRSKSRRKHDRQQGERLEALGTVGFELVQHGADARSIIDIMFCQRSARFKAMGIADPFVRGGLVAFYQAAALPGSGVDVRLHVLRLNGEVVAVRYNVVHGDRMFCLISSMSENSAIQNGSPGKQCLLRVMQSVFEQDIASFDMGAGFTDEKRHWCNASIELRQHYLPLNWRGVVVCGVHQAAQRARCWVKANKQLLAVLRWPGQTLHRLTAGPGKANSEQL